MTEPVELPLGVDKRQQLFTVVDAFRLRIVASSQEFDWLNGLILTV